MIFANFMLFSVSLDHADEFALGFFLHLDAEIDEDGEGDTTDERVDRSAQSQSIIDPVRHHRYEQDGYGILGGALHEMVEGVVIAHQHGKGIVSGDREQGASDGCSEPVLLAVEIEEILHGGKTQTDANGVDDTVIMLVKIRVLAQDEPKDEQFGGFFGYGGYEEGFGGGAEERCR